LHSIAIATWSRGRSTNTSICRSFPMIVFPRFTSRYTTSPCSPPYWWWMYPAIKSRYWCPVTSHPEPQLRAAAHRLLDALARELAPPLLHQPPVRDLHRFRTHVVPRERAPEPHRRHAHRPRSHERIHHDLPALAALPDQHLAHARRFLRRISADD